MALNIPNTQSGLQGLLGGVQAGGNLFQQIMHPVLQREINKQKAEQFKMQHELAKAAAGRASAAAGRQAQLFPFLLQKAQHEANPLAYLSQLENQFGGINQGGEDKYQSYVPGIGGGFGQNQGEPNQVPQNFGALQGYLQQMGMPMQSETASAPQMGAEQVEQIPQAGVPYEKASVSNPLLAPEDFKELRRQALYKAAGFKAPLAHESPLQGSAREASDLARLKKQVEEGRADPQVYEDARAAFDAKKEAKQDLRDLRARTKAGLKPGEKEFFDKDSGIPLGKEIPLNAKERESEEGNSLFNELYPYVYKGASPFSGEGSITRLENAMSQYKTNPKARKLVDDLLLADKMLAATTVNEASTLKAGRTNRTYNMLKESLEAGDVPKRLKSLMKQYQLPPSASLKASMRYQELLSNARKSAKKNTPATQKLYYTPELQAAHEAQQEEDNTSDISQLSDAELRKIAGGK